MKIAIDYDGTYSAAPELWEYFINLAESQGHDVRIVTHREETKDNISDKIHPQIKIIYTDGVAKQWFCERRGDFWVPDVWIDDKPRGIFENGPLSQTQIDEWRANR